MTLSNPSQRSGQPSAAGSARTRAGQALGFVPLALALVITLLLGGASVARAFTVPPLDAHTDLEFSLDGTIWADAPDLVLGAWGCDLAGEPVIPDPVGAIGGTVGVDPCAMSPGEYIDRTYYVRNSTNTGRTGVYEVGIGEFELSDLAEFAVSSVITGAPGSVTLYGPETAQADQTPAPETRLAAVQLAPGVGVKVVDTVSIPTSPVNYEQDQSVSPRMWVSFSDIGGVDTDHDGLPNNVEGEIGTDPDDPYNPLPDGTAGQRYGPHNFLPNTPDGVTVVVDTSTLPPGMTLENGVLGGRPGSPGTYDIEFIITMPGGAEFTSIRRVVIHPSGGGSSDLPDLFWPIVVGGIIGVIVGIIAPGWGSVAGSVGGSAGGSAGGAIDSIEGSGSGSGSGSGTGSAQGSIDGSLGGSAAGSVGGTVGNWISGVFGNLTSALGSLGSVGSAGSAGSGAAAADSTRPGGPGGSIPAGSVPGTGADQGDKDDGTTGQILVETVTPREGSPSDEWARANSEVRSSLPATGVGAADLVLWALTAAAAGATLILFAKRRRGRGAED